MDDVPQLEALAIPETPSKKGDIGKYLKRLNLEHDLHLPWDENESPSKKRKSPGHDVAKAISFLYFQDPQALDRAVNEFRTELPKLNSPEKKVNYLLDKLTDARAKSLKTRTPRSLRRSPRDRGLGHSADPPDPVSPTLSVRHGPRPELPVDDLDRSSVRAFRMPSVKRPRSSTALDAGPPSVTGRQIGNISYPSLPGVGDDGTIDRSLDMAGGMLPPRGTIDRNLFGNNIQRKSSGVNTIPNPSERSFGSTSANTSFNMNGINTSFTSNGLTSADTSFWSDAQQGTQEDPASPATSVNTTADYFTPESKTPALGLDGANDSTDVIDRTGAQDFELEFGTQHTYYGSSPIASQVEEIAAQAGQTFQARPIQPSVSIAQSLPQPTLPDARYDGPRLPDLLPGVSGAQFKPEKPSINSSASSLFPGIKRLQPTETIKQPLPSPPRTDSPSKSHMLTGKDRLDRIPFDGLSGSFLSQSILALPFDLRWEATRVLQSSEMSSVDLEAAWSHPRTMESLHKLPKLQGVRHERGHATDFSEHGLAAKLRWSRKGHGRVFELELCPPRKDYSNAFERRFGRERFVTVDVPPLTKPTKEVDLGEYGMLIPGQVRELFKQEQRFAGRVWRQFLVQPKKSRRTGKINAKGTLQVTFFAVRSEESEPVESRLPPITITTLLNWAVQFTDNKNSPQCKLYSRLDLAASRTIPTLIFDPSEIVLDHADQMPTNQPENDVFHDPALSPDNSKSMDPMNDGCCRISTWAMREIQRMLGLKYLPSVVQGRICGAKGIWYRDDDDASLRQKPKKLIWISHSQIKVLQSQTSFWSDPHKVTFNVVKTSGQPMPSFLYADFLPILRDRKVPTSVIEQVVKDSARAMTNEFLDASKDRVTLGDWIHQQKRFRGESGIDSVGDFAFSKEEQILQMLESGFDPTGCKHLATETHDSFKQYLERIRASFKTELKNSTMLIGIADPYGILQPGEIHVGFSSPFNDADQSRTNLKDRQALVSRLPSLGAPDIQRVRCVFKAELSHLTDVVVFPSIGPRSLASKLQGGDYDGDTFVVIWEDSLVKHFWNAPVPSSEDPPEKFGIRVDKTKMGALVQEYLGSHFDEKQVLHWININTEKRMQFDLLGSITLMYEKVVYHDNSLNTYRAQQVLRLHDLMIDAAKQGYHLSWDAWNAFKREHGLDKLGGLPEPAHRAFAKGTEAIRKQMRSNNKTRNPDNISDHIYFEVVEPELVEALGQAKAVADQAPTSDPDVGQLFCNILQQTKNSPAHAEIVSLSNKVEAMRKRWPLYTAKFFKDDTPWREVVEEVRADFESIMPDDLTSPDVRWWLYRSGSNPTIWEKLKASCLELVKASPKCMFSAAGYELCFIKAFATGRARPVRMDFYNHLKPKKRKRTVDGPAEEEEEEAVVEMPDIAELA